MNDGNYLVIQGWMRTKLGLKGNELLVYALIYGFSQDGESKFVGSAKYISEWVGITKKATFAILKKMTEAGLILRHEKIVNGVSLVDYSINVEKLSFDENFPTDNNSSLPPREKTSLPLIYNNNNNNIKNNIIINNNIKKKEEIFQEKWNGFCSQVKGNTSKCVILTDKRKRQMQELFKQAEVLRKQRCPDKELIRFIMEDIIFPAWSNSKFLQGKIKSDKYQDQFKFDIDYVLNPKYFAQMIERNVNN